MHRLIRSSALAEIVGDGRPCTVLMISLLSMPPEVDACDAKVGVPELPLDHDERPALMCHLDRVGVPKLVRCEPAPDARSSGRVMQLFAGGRRLPAPASSRPVNTPQTPPASSLAAGAPVCSMA